MLLSSKHVVALSCVVVLAAAHAQLVYPPSNRAGASYASAGKCNGPFGCLWFSQPVLIPGEPVNNDASTRTYNVDVNGGPLDWSYKNPWRAPGTAPVLGSGCGVAGGNPVVLFDGGVSPPGVPQGEDGVLQPEQPPTTWRMGESVEVGVAMTANHGGGWSYRLCKKTGSLDDISEACFQRTPLRFASDSQWLQFSPAIVPGAPRVRIPLTKLTENTSPPGSEWARNPVPACNFCSQAACGPPTMQPNYTAPSGKFPWGDREVEYYGGSEWIKWIRCGVVCAGEDPHQTFVNETGEHRPPSGLLCNGATQFAEPYPGVSGFVTNSTYPERAITAFSVVDELLVPDDIDEGDYILSWRWDCEQSPQVWQNCADIRIVAADSDSPTNLSPINIIAV